MQLITQTEAANIVGVKQPIIARYIKKGFIKRYDGGKVNIEEVKAHREAVFREPTGKEDIQSINTAPLKKYDNTTSKTKSTTPETKNKMTYAAAKTHKETFNAKLAEITYKERMGELITLDQAKGVVEVMFTPLSRKLDDLHIDLKSRYPNIEMEAIEWLGEYINDIKKTVSEHRWE